MKYIHIVGIAIFATLGCASQQGQQQQQQQQPPTRAQLERDAQEKVDAYCVNLMAAPSLTPLRSKVVLGAEKPTFAMLADSARATESERRTIRDWATRSMHCQEALRKVFQQYRTSMHLVLFDSWADESDALRVRLHDGLLTFGQYNQERQKLTSRARAAWVKLDGELARRNAEAVYMAQRLSQQNFQAYQQQQLLQQEQQFRQQLLQQQQQQQQLQQQQLQQQQQRQQQHGGMITCNQIGQYTYCNY
jgi:hypothetical protein